MPITCHITTLSTFSSSLRKFCHRVMHTIITKYEIENIKQIYLFIILFLRCVSFMVYNMNQFMWSEPVGFINVQNTWCKTQFGQSCQQLPTNKKYVTIRAKLPTKYRKNNDWERPVVCLRYLLYYPFLKN